MSQSKRARRPKIERAAPRRNFAGAFADAGSGEKPAKNGAARNAAKNDAARNAAARNSGAGTNGVHEGREQDPGWVDARDASYEAINNGYRVIDEYMRQGQRLAEEFWLPSPDAAGVGSELTRMMDRFLRSAGDMGSAWLEMMTQWTQAKDRDTGGPRGTAGPFSAGSPVGTTRAGNGGAAAHAEPSESLSVVLESSRKVRLSVESGALSAGVTVHALVCSNPEVRPITGATVDGASLRVVVPDDQPAGVYYGVLVDTGTGRPAGVITLTVL